MHTTGGAELYEFHLRGELSELMASAFDGFDASSHDGVTVLAGLVGDQAALFGVLAQIEALGLQLIEVRRAR